MKRKGRRAKLGLIKPAGVEPETWTMLTAARGGQRGKMVQLLAADPGRVQLESGWSSVMINTILGFLLMIRFCGGPAYQRPHQRVFLHLPIFYPQVSIDHNPSHCICGHRYLESHIR